MYCTRLKYTVYFYCTIASQTWTLARLLPIMVDDDCWKFYLMTLTMTDLLLCPDIKQDEVAYLSILITEVYTKFVELFPNATVIPKMHFLLHAPRLILM